MSECRLGQGGALVLATGPRHAGAMPESIRQLVRRIPSAIWSGSDVQVGAMCGGVMNDDTAPGGAL